MPEKSEKSKSPNTTRAAAAWHAGIAFELKNPVIPDDAPPELKAEIEAQREAHETFAKVLKRLASAAGTK